MTIRLDFFVAMEPPRTTHQTKEVVVVKNKARFYEPPKLVAARSKLKAHLAKHRPEKPLEGPIRVLVKWLFQTKNNNEHGTYKITRPDCHNMNKLLFDVMTDLGFWHDDAQICSEHIEKFWTTAVTGIFIQIEAIPHQGVD